MARESKNGGNVKSNAAAIQSSGRRGMLVSVLIELRALLLLIADWSEQTQNAQAVMKMHLPKGWRNFLAWKTQAIRMPRTFSLDHPQRELRQPFFDICKLELRKIEIHRAFSFGSKLFCHQRLPACHGFPINVTLGFSSNIRAHPGKIVATPNSFLKSAIGKS